MDKLAQIRDSEVRGVLAAFVDNGLIKVASREDFDALSAVVADNVGYDYDINDIAEVTGAALNGFIKTAEEAWRDTRNAIGHLYLMKTAGELSDYEFEYGAYKLLKLAEMDPNYKEYLLAKKKAGGFGNLSDRRATIERNKQNRIHAAREEELANNSAFNPKNKQKRVYKRSRIKNPSEAKVNNAVAEAVEAVSEAPAQTPVAVKPGTIARLKELGSSGWNKAKDYGSRGLNALKSGGSRGITAIKNNPGKAGLAAAGLAALGTGGYAAYKHYNDD